MSDQTADADPAHQLATAMERQAGISVSVGLDLVLPVVLPGCTAQDLPLWLTPVSVTFYQVDEFSLAGAENLVRALTAQPREILPGLGPVPDLSPRGHQLTARQAERPAADEDGGTGRGQWTDVVPREVRLKPSGPGCSQC